MVRNNLPPLKREVARSAGGILTHCQAESARNCVSHPFQCRGEHRSSGLTPLPCRASPLKRRRFVKASSLEEVARSAGGILTHCQAESARNCVSHPFQCRGEHRSSGLTPLPCRASPLKRRRFVKASSLEEVARSAGGVTHQRANNVRPYKAVSQYIIIRPIHIP